MHLRTCAAFIASVSLLIGVGVRPERDSIGYTADFGIGPDMPLVPSGANAYVSLDPGVFLRYAGVDENGDDQEVRVRVLDRVRTIVHVLDGARLSTPARVVEERLWINGELVEVTLSYYARCAETGSVFTFGEDTTVYEQGVVVESEGWLAGRDGARLGLLMPAQFLVGARYMQEAAPGVSMDGSEHYAMGVRVETPAGVFDNCVVVQEVSLDDPDEDDETLKIYAPGVGPVVDGRLQLVEYHR